MNFEEIDKEILHHKTDTDVASDLPKEIEVIQGKCSLISKSRFLLELSQFNKVISKIFRRIASKHYRKYFYMFLFVYFG